MKLRWLAIFFTVLTFAVPANAINVVTAARGWWGYDGGSGTNGSAGDFILAGGLGKGGQHGTHGDEWAVVGMVANTIVEHGGYFCPYQIQCANKRKKRKTWTMYYHPTGYSRVGCTWLCEPGYGGHNCASQTTVSTCDTKNYGTGSGQKFNGLSLKTSGGDADQKEGEVSGFNQFGSDPEHDVILGIVKYLEHGVIAGPVQIKCGRNNWKDIDSYVESVLAATGQQKLLCAPGYTANAGGSDCVPISADLCATQGMTFCSNFDRSKYDSSIHTLEPAGNCAKFFCTDRNKAFPRAGDFTCADCSSGVKGGASTANGVCVQCQSGEYFDKASNSCKSAAAFSKTDLQYGKGMTKNNTAVDDQCWTLTTPEDYRGCVKK